MQSSAKSLFENCEGRCGEGFWLGLCGGFFVFCVFFCGLNQKAVSRSGQWSVVRLQKRSQDLK